ncbi:MAG: AarF/ABC1/UbiB kinase family protein [Pseudobutyrivibrio sp.]|nr:AarF/ABC1/UbiB kinase family protein [Pseudobutyrivibrio sp.]
MQNTTDNTQSDDSLRFNEIKAVLKKHQLGRGINPVKLREILEDLGPTYVKLGQIMSLHSDILPRSYCDELLNLTSDVAPMPFEVVISVIEESLGEDYTTLFKSIEETPIGSASIAQVHRARLLNGEPVVIKVQRPGVYETMSRDITLLHKVVRRMPSIAGIKSMVDLDMILDEMWAVAQQELNFITESSNILEFTEYNKDVVYIYIPKFYKEYTTDKVLVMEYIDGQAINDRQLLESRGYDTEEIGKKLVNNFIKQVMEDGFFHADPHPGNLRIREGKIVWFDMGMMGRLTERQRRIMIRGVEAIALKDINMLEGAVYDLCDTKGKVNRKRLYEDLRNFLNKYGSMSMGNVKVPETLMDLVDIMKKNNLVMPQGVSMLARAFAHIEGLLASISPDINMIDIAIDRMQEAFIHEFNIKKELGSFARKMYRSTNKGVELPSLMADALRDYLNGEAKTNLTMQISGPFAELVASSIRNLVIGMCLAGLLVGSAIICVTDMEPKILGIPFLGFIGFSIASSMTTFLIMRYFIRWFIKKMRERR